LEFDIGLYEPNELEFDERHDVRDLLLGDDDHCPTSALLPEGQKTSQALSAAYLWAVRRYDDDIADDKRHVGLDVGLDQRHRVKYQSYEF
jgi:hypothetical protein